MYPELEALIRAYDAALEASPREAAAYHFRDHAAQYQ
jgi:hypothetical protein